jgi:hypothetical protein
VAATAQEPAAATSAPPGVDVGGASRAGAARREQVTSRWLALAAAILAVALVAATATGVTLWRAGQLQAQITQLQQQTRLDDAATAVLAAEDARLLDVETDLGGDVRVAVADSLDRGVVVADDLQAPPSDRVYQLWVLEGDQPRSAGVIERRNGVVGEVTGVTVAQALAISVEPPSGSDAPTGPIVVRAPLN